MKQILKFAPLALAVLAVACGPQIKKQEEVVKQNARMLDEARAKYDRLDAELQIIEATFGENSDEVKALTAEQEKAATACLKWEENTNKATTALNNMKAELDGLPSNIELVGQKMEAAGLIETVK